MVALFLLLSAGAVHAAEPLVIGLSQTKRAIEGVQIPGRDDDAPNVVLLGGLDGARSQAVTNAAQGFEAIPLRKRRFSLAAFPLANPDGADLAFPPAGTAYRQNPEAHFLWRWLGVHAPDLVIVAGDDKGLIEAMAKNAVGGVGRIPARRMPGAKGILDSIPQQIAASEAHSERRRRLLRSPIEIAEELAQFYGHDFEQAVYIPAMSLIGRLRIGQQAEVERLVAPYVSGGKDSLSRATGSHLAGHLIFAELAEKTGDRRYIERVRAAADWAYSDDMSDAVFMHCPILAAAGKLTGEPLYFDKAAQHLAGMQRVDLRPDGLYRHSPLCDAAWGRGNAFPALGLALALSYVPRSHPAHAEMLRSFQTHLSTLAKYQDRDGMWHQVIDRPGSYAEFSATAMIAVAISRGLKNGWLDQSYEPRLRAAWRGVVTRIGPGGALLDVCESTGKQKTEEDYLNRAASSGHDDRGGGMALLLATEPPLLHR